MVEIHEMSCTGSFTYPVFCFIDKKVRRSIMLDLKKHLTETGRCIAFITPEISIERLHVYSGGLGVIGGSMIGASFRSDFPLVAVSLLYTEGYYDQGINHHLDGGRSHMTIEYTSRNYDDILEDTGVIVTVYVHGAPIYAKVRRLPRGVFHTTEVLFLDVDIPENDYISRLNGKRLYPCLISTEDNKEHNDARRIAQSMILGFGAVKALKALGYNIALYHLNEGHAGFVPFALLQEFQADGNDPEQAKTLTRSKVVFTTHTPVSAGNPKYGADMVHRFLADPTLAQFVHDATMDGYFDLTASSLLLSSIANGVSRKHGEVSRQMWQGLKHGAQIGHVTNGVNQNSWQCLEFRDATTVNDLKNAKRGHKRHLLARIRKTTGKMWSEEVLTLVWARRFAGYKRPGLLFADYEWIEQHLQKSNMQVIIAGKPHPDDTAMINEWNNMLRKAYGLPNLVVLAGYELELSRFLKAGADVWLNNPAAPFEACGTSGMSAAMNGAINVSTPDGWYLEADDNLHFRFGINYHCIGQDRIDNIALKECIDQRVLPMYYGNKEEWYSIALKAKIEAETMWSSDRMLQDYADRVYNPALKKASHR